MRLYSTRQRVALAVFAALNGLDILTTHIALAQGIPEASPLLARVFWEHGGELTMFGVKLIVSGFVLAAILRLHQYPKLWGAVYASAAMFGVAVLSNLSQIT